MYRRLGALAENGSEFDPTFGADFSAPEPEERTPPLPESGSGGAGGGGASISGNPFDAIAQIIRSLTGGGSVRVAVPGAQGYPGAGGCAWNQCPSQHGPLVICQPCAAPAGAPGPLFPAVTGSSWFWPVVLIGGVVLLATRK